MTVLHIYSHGDRSVGIPSEMVKVEFPMRNASSLSDYERKEIREHITDFFREFLDDGYLDVWFDDECPDCLVKMTPVVLRGCNAKGKPMEAEVAYRCENPNCISNVSDGGDY